jgi:hypothetical protein
MTKQTKDEGPIEVRNRKAAFGEATESPQLSLIDELASYVGARKRTSPKRVRSTRSIRESSDPAYDPDTLDLFDNIEATILDDSIKSDAQILQSIDRIVSDHKEKAARAIRRSIIKELETLLEALD